ncbi:MAG: hypothetical protein EXR71_06730 [Myxococcales bacterium]|nr:hypothetical protein [Myxococcales bacterium]
MAAICVVEAAAFAAQFVNFQQNIAPAGAGGYQHLLGYCWSVFGLSVVVSVVSFPGMVYDNRWRRETRAQPERVWLAVLGPIGLGLCLSWLAIVNLERNILPPASLLQRTYGTWVPTLALLLTWALSAFMGAYYRDRWLRLRAIQGPAPGASV